MRKKRYFKSVLSLSCLHSIDALISWVHDVRENSPRNKNEQGKSKLLMTEKVLWESGSSYFLSALSLQLYSALKKIGSKLTPYVFNGIIHFEIIWSEAWKTQPIF